MAFTIVTVSNANVHKEDGTVATGSFSFKATAKMQNGGEIREPTLITVPITAGAVSVQLPATDDVGTLPVGVTYTVTEAITGLPDQIWQLVVPHANATLDLSTVTPALPSTALSTYVDLANAQTITGVKVFSQGLLTNASTFAAAIVASGGEVVNGEVWAPPPSGASQTTVINAILAAMFTAGVGTLRFWPGTYLANLLVPSFIELRGCGKDVTVLKSVAGSLTDVIQGTHFLTLTGTGTNPDNTRGDNFITIRDLTIDGNVANNLAATTTTNNSILAGATTITFTNSPAGFANGDTVLLEPGAFGSGKCESVKLISGAGTNTWTVGQSLDGTGGVYWAHNASITIQSNRGYGIRVWGRSHNWHDLTIQNCGQDGAWTEFAQDVSFANSTQSLESTFHDIRSINCNGHGWTHRGPHDSNFTDMYFWGHGAYSFRSEWSLPTYNGGIGFCRGWMSYLITNSYFFGGAVSVLDDMTASAASRGNGFEFTAQAGNLRGTNLRCSGHQNGMLLTNVSGGLIQHTTDAIAGDGMILNGTGNCILDGSFSNCGNAIRITSEGNDNIVRATVQTTAGGQTTLIGSFNSNDTVDLHAFGSGTNTNLIQFPTRTLKAGGWSPILPTSNSTMVTTGRITLQTGAANPTLTTNLTGVMMGLAVGFTPNETGKVLITCTGDAFSSVIGDGVQAQIAYGTPIGSAPVNGAAPAGTLVGNLVKYVASTVAGKAPFCLSALITGLTPGTGYWLDLQVAAITGGNASVENVAFTVMEI